jgi:hypothetical protein
MLQTQKSAIKDLNKGRGAPEKVLRGLHALFKPIVLGLLYQERSERPFEDILIFKSQFPNLYKVLRG